MTIDIREEIQAGGTTQWIRVRGADGANPVLLLIQHQAALSLAAMTRDNVSLHAPQEAGEQSQDEPLVSGDDDETFPPSGWQPPGLPPTRLRTTSS